MDIAQAIQQRDAGIARSAETSGPEWQRYAIGFVRGYLQANEFLHVDDLWDSGLKEPESPRALGAVMQHAIHRNWISPVMVPGTTWQAAKASVRSNQQLKPVWRSSLWVGL